MKASFALAAVLATALCGCGADPEVPRAESRSEPAQLTGRGEARPEAPPAALRELTVLAASSLQETFTTIARRFEAAHPGVHVTLSFGGSQELRVQIENGAPADVFASADTKNMEKLRPGGHALREVIFARNVPVLVVPRANPAKVHSVEDLPRATHIVVGAPEVPIGAYTVQILEAATRRFGQAFRTAVEQRIASRELNVRQVLAKVMLGEADVGVVYRTDARAQSAAVQMIELPADLQVIAEYPMAILKHGREPELARAWVETVLGPEGQGLLADHGFLPAAP